VNTGRPRGAILRAFACPYSVKVAQKVKSTNFITARQHSLLCSLQSAVLAMIDSVRPSDRPTV